MRTVFFGASRLGHRCCRLLIEEGLAEVVGIVTAPESFRISYTPAPVVNRLHQDFNDIGQVHGIPVLTMDGTMASCSDFLGALEPELFVAIGWYHMIPAALRSLASRGCVGIHASLLPRFRGGAPLVWAMIQGEAETGVSLFHFSGGVDDGDIIGQRAFPITDADTIRELLEKAESASLDLLREFIPKLAAGTAPRIRQREADATRFPQRSPGDGRIDWSWDPRRIRNFIRAQTRPYPGAFTVIGDRKVVIWDADVEGLPDAGDGPDA